MNSYTPTLLREIAAQAEVRYTALAAQFGPGTINQDRNDARREMESARACSDWMQAQGIEQLANVGPFMLTKISRGMSVRVRKGARIFGTGPSIPKEGIESKRAQLITVHSVDPGYLDNYDRSSGTRVVQGKVHWAGSGGYWRGTDLNNIEIVSAHPADIRP